MIKNINLEIYTKDKKIFKGIGDSIIFSANNETEITILPNHIPIITFVDNTYLVFKKGTSKKVFKLGRGLFKFFKNSAKIIIDDIKE